MNTCAYTYACVHACVCDSVCEYVCVYVCLYVCDLFLHACLKQTDSRTCVCMHRYVLMHVRMCVYVCMHTRMNCTFMLYERPNRGYALVPTCLVRCGSHHVHRNQVDCVPYNLLPPTTTTYHCNYYYYNYHDRNY